MTFFKGIIIGIGKILPGVSGSVLAILFGEYEKIMYSLKNIKKNYIYLIKIFSGIIIAILLFSNVIIYLLNYYYLNTMLFFIGLMIGGIPKLYKKIETKNLWITIISILLLLLLTSYKFNISFNTSTFIGKFILGSIESISTIIPGISGTAIFMMMNVYDEIITNISNVLNINYIKETIHFFTPYIFGIIIMSIFLIEIINAFYYKYKNIFNSIIFGFSLYSILYLFLKTFEKNYSIINIIISIILMFIGIKISLLLNKIN